MTAIARVQLAARRATLLLTPLAYSFITAAPAWATVGGVGAALWVGVTDSSGVPVGAYGLSLNNGSLTNPMAAPSALSQNWLYSAFLTVIGLALWLVDNVLGFQWLQIIATPIDYVGRQISALTLSPAMVLAVGTIAAVIIAYNLAVGRMSRAGAQIGFAVILVLLAVTVGHGPISKLVGPSGALAQARDIGIEVSSDLSGKSVTGQEAIDQITTSLADHFARTPTLVWNWGADLDAAPYNCGDVWSAGVKAASTTGGDLDNVKDAVKTGCPYGEQLHEYAMSDSPSKTVIGFFAVIFALAVLLVFGYLCYRVVILALSALFWAIVAIVALITGMVPGGSQTLAIKAALDTVFAVLGLIGYVAINGLVGHLTTAMFSLAGDNVVMTMPLVTLLLVALVLALRKVGNGLLGYRDKAARAIGALTSRDGATNGALAAAGTEGPSLLDRLDPLTAVPHAGRRLATTAKGLASTAAKVGVAAAAPQAAPFVGAADQLQSRLTTQNLRKNRHERAATEQSTADSNTPSPHSNEGQFTPSEQSTPQQTGSYNAGMPPVVNQTDSQTTTPAPSPPPAQEQHTPPPAGSASRVDQLTHTPPRGPRPTDNAHSYTPPDYNPPPSPTVRPTWRRDFPAGDPRNDVRLTYTDRGFTQTRVHPAILAVANRSADPQAIGDADDMPESSRDIRHDLMGGRPESRH